MATTKDKKNIKEESEKIVKPKKKLVKKTIKKKTIKKKTRKKTATEKYQVGRPSGFSEELLENVYTYIEKNKTGLKPVSVEGLAFELNVSKQNLYNWKKKHVALFDALEILKALQAKKLLEYGLTGKYNATIAKLQLSSNHGYFDKVKEESKQSIQTKTVDAILDEIDGDY